MKIILYILILFLFITCSKDNNDTVEDNCLGLPNDYSSQYTCEEIGMSDYYCKFEIIQDLYLDDNSKKLIPQYCNNLGDVLIFQNAKHDKMFFTLIYKNYNRQSSSRIINWKCTQDSTKWEALCFKNEKISIGLKDNFSNLVFELEIESNLDRNNPSSYKYGDYLDIYVHQENKKYIYNYFTAIVHKGTLIEDKLSFQEQVGSITLNDYKYFDVITNNFRFSTGFNFFYSKVSGLVGFIDNKGVTWNLL